MSRPLNPVREHYVREYRLTPRQVRRITGQFLEQLIACQSEEARRILLGVSTNNQPTKGA